MYVFMLRNKRLLSYYCIMIWSAVYDEADFFDGKIAAHVKDWWPH